ncbi:DNA repair protein rad60 [Taphrina deformans PYCC 5710]|uniref:DNA repair protein rad60 n=1 Tax=Taphrina deformans (strain PYCC 5710 / ATCC 11124 / CBS 356.35 / IMI 108563 / JCM 9778 / NBRC 8474) TaxID=1097556 RepID=R4X8X2_TAPDE|nr:DNA repair protein rad60 [Taphrina deformans PYCC 5710]|eukprot:CCG82083.1 DNA repair protein rad60 [Taphrina deformans PYCC 5710]
MDDDEAAFFSRPRKGIGAESTKKRSFHNEQILNGVASGSDTATESDSDPGDRVLEGSNSPKKRPPKRAAVLRKVKSNVIELDSDSDVSDSANRTKVNKEESKGRTRRKSDSLSPPPQLSPRRRLAGTQIIKEAFRNKSHDMSSDLLTTTIQADEAEMLFEEQMRQRTSGEGGAETDQSASINRGSPLPSNILSRHSSDVLNNMPDNLLDIVIRGVHVEIPNSISIVSDVGLWEVPKIIRIRLNTKLSIAKIGFCKEAGLSTIENGVKVITTNDQKKIDEIILTYRNIRIFDYVTPHGLGIIAGDRPYFEAFTKQGWQCLEQFPELRKAQSSSAAARTRSVKDDNASDHSTEPKNVESSGSSFTRVTLKSNDGRELKIRTRPTTKISAIIAGFRKTNAIPEATKIELRFDGEVLDGIMADHDIEDQNVVDVKIY